MEKMETTEIPDVMMLRTELAAAQVQMGANPPVLMTIPGAYSGGKQVPLRFLFTSPHRKHAEMIHEIH